MPYYAHIRQDENGQTIDQAVAEHLTGTAALCREFAADFGAEADGDLMGLAHDLGKCTDAFQKRLLEGGPVVDHTMAGMLTCIKMKRPSAAACVAGHHGGLLDVGNLRTDRAGEATLSGRFKKGVEGHYLERCGESGVTLPTLPPETPERNPLKASFRTRMLYSCLVDADFLDTERFMDGERGRGGYDDLPTLLRRLNEYIAPWQEPKTALNKLRCKILNSCLDKGSKPKGIYTLTVPTGGGKTVASLAFALRHAVAHGMKRVIYVVPYTSIIEQNAEVFREILGDGNVLEHHSGVQFELSDGASPEEVRRALAAENWDMPVIVTTAVQFFESIYANRSSKCRKLHNLADSVIIFDEAQMLPLCHLRPCVAAMASLAEQFRSTLVLCTATQPSLDDLLHTYAPSCPITELCPQTAEEYDSFRRVTFRQEGILEDDALAEKLHFKSLSAWLPFETWFGKDQPVAATVSYELIQDHYYKPASGNQVQSIADGVVLYIGEQESGAIVMVKQDNGVLVTYGALQEVQVHLNDRILKGTAIGAVQDAVYLEFSEQGQPVTLQRAMGDED